MLEALVTIYMQYIQDIGYYQTNIIHKREKDDVMHVVCCVYFMNLSTHPTPSVQELKLTHIPITSEQKQQNEIK